MTKEAEERIVRGVEQVVDLVGDGWTPNDAIVKIAHDGEYTPGHIRLMVQAYNTGRTNYQRKTHADLFEKTADFPLADAAVVLEALYPSTVKSAAMLHRESSVSDDYLYPPESPGHKLATVPPLVQPVSPYPCDPDRRVKKAFALLRDLDRERDERRMLVSHTRDKLAAALDELDLYFKQAGPPIAFKAVRNNASALWGRPAEVVLDKVAEANPRLLKTASWDSYGGRVDRTREPYVLVGKCIELAQEHHKLAQDYQEFEKAAVEAAARLLGEFLPVTHKEPSVLTTSIMGTEKAALLGSGILDPISAAPFAVTSEFTRSVMDKIKPDSEDKLKSKALAELMDPAHEARLRKIRTQATLHNLMANDEFVSAEHPERVAELFNKITSLAPRAAEQPILMQALMRRYLAQGQVDPHDIDQLVGIEYKLKQRDQPMEDIPAYPGLQFGGSKPPRAQKEGLT
jgi:hypothetical protein